jgi:hypothetical protein
MGRASNHISLLFLLGVSLFLSGCSLSSLNPFEEEAVEVPGSIAASDLQSITGTIAKGARATIFNIPLGIANILITLNSTVDIDLELWDGTTKVVGAGQDAKINKAGSNQKYQGKNGEDTINYSGPTGGNETIRIVGVIQNQYQVMVFGFQTGRLSSAKYTATFYFETDLMFDIHHNDPCEPVNPATPILTNVTYNASINPISDVDIFRFNVLKGITYVIYVTLGSLNDAELKLFKEDCSTSLDAKDDDEKKKSSPFQLFRTVDYSGIAIIKVSAPHNSRPGTYQVRVTEPPSTFLENFSSFDPKMWEKIDRAANGTPPFQPEDVKFDPMYAPVIAGYLSLRVPKPNSNPQGGALHSMPLFSVGEYRARLRTSKVRNTVASFYLFSPESKEEIRKEEIRIDIPWFRVKDAQLDTKITGGVCPNEADHNSFQVLLTIIRRDATKTTKKCVVKSLPFDPSRAFHQYWIILSNTMVTFGVDNITLQTQTWQLDEPFLVGLSAWPDPMGPSTTATVLVDWVQKQ